MYEQALFDGDGQVGAVEQEDRPGGRGRAGRAIGDRGQAGRRCAGGEACAASRRKGEGAGRRCPWGGALRGEDAAGRALFEHDDDAVAAARGGQDIDAVAVARAAAQENADGFGAARLEHVGRLHADTAPEAAPFGHRAGHDLLGLACRGVGAFPAMHIDRLRRGLAGRGGQGEKRKRREPVKGPLKLL